MWAASTSPFSVLIGMTEFGKECEYWVDEKKVGLRELREEGYDSLLKRAIEKRLAKLEHESLLVKADLLMRLCSLPKEFVSLTKNYVYDRDTLVRLDDERHKLVHGGRWAGLFRRNDEDLEYLYDTGLYFLDVVSFRCHPQDVRTRGREAP